jgi:hypothetical protein
MAVAAISIAAAARADTAPVETSLGRQLFFGEIDLQGRIRTHRENLRPDVLRCANCHAFADGPEVPRSLAPRLGRDILLGRHARRGGPSSVYSLGTFCKLLRDGVDPAFVLISLEMPVYALDDGQCRALWGFLLWSADAANSS